MVAVFKPTYDILNFSWLEMVQWKANYSTSLVYWESTATDCNETELYVPSSKKDVYLSDDNLADDEKNITESNERERKNY